MQHLFKTVSVKLDGQKWKNRALTSLYPLPDTQTGRVRTNEAIWPPCLRRGCRQPRRSQVALGQQVEGHQHTLESVPHLLAAEGSSLSLPQPPSGCRNEPTEQKAAQTARGELPSVQTQEGTNREYLVSPHCFPFAQIKEENWKPPLSRT